MYAASKRKIASHEVCTGCSLCLLTCPAWRKTGDRSLTAQGRLRAMQSGAELEDVSASIDECLLCGSCTQACPEENDVVGLTIDQRRALNKTRKNPPAWHPGPILKPRGKRAPCRGTVLLSARADGDGALQPLARRVGGIDEIADDCADIVRAHEAGVAVAPSAIDDFVAPLKSATRVLVEDGGVLRFLRQHLPPGKITGFAQYLLAEKSVRASIGRRDLYVIDSRAYHDDFNRLVGFYDELRRETQADFNLDLQRSAIPTGATSLQAAHDVNAAGCALQAGWILHGKKPDRIIVEALADLNVFRQVVKIPVVHLAELLK